MTSKRLLDMTFPAEFASVDLARNSVLSVCREAFPQESEASSDFCMAINEAMNNAVEHSGSPMVEIEILAGDSSMTFRMSTSGERFDPTGSAAMPDLDDLEDLPEGGYGLALIQAFVDRLDYEYRDGKNIMTLVKYTQNGGAPDGN